MYKRQNIFKSLVSLRVSQSDPLLHSELILGSMEVGRNCWGATIVDLLETWMWYHKDPEEWPEYREKIRQGPAPMLSALHQRLRENNSTFLTTESLQGFNVDICGVQNLDDEVHFSPCFFRPRPGKLFEGFPRIPKREPRPYSLYTFPSADRSHLWAWKFICEIYEPRENLKPLLGEDYPDHNFPGLVEYSNLDNIV